MNLFFQQVRFATKKSGGSSTNGRTSNPKNLGIKRADGKLVKPGTIIVRQRGLEYDCGIGVGVARDHSLYAKKDGIVNFRYDLSRQKRVVSVVDEYDVLPGNGSKKLAKSRLSNAIDFEKYLDSDSAGRLKLVTEASNRIIESDLKSKQEALNKKLLSPFRNDLLLVDLTRI